MPVRMTVTRAVTSPADLRLFRTGWTASQLASRIPISPSVFSRWENGLDTPSLEQIGRWAAALDVSEKDLLTLLREVKPRTKPRRHYRGVPPTPPNPEEPAVATEAGGE